MLVILNKRNTLSGIEFTGHCGSNKYSIKLTAKNTMYTIDLRHHILLSRK